MWEDRREPAARRGLSTRLSYRDCSGRRHDPASAVRVALEIEVSSRVGHDLSPLVVHRHTEDLSDVRRRWLLQGTEVEMVQDLADGNGIGDVGHDLERPSAVSADEGIRLKDLGDEARPAGRAAALVGPPACL